MNHTIPPDLELTAFNEQTTSSVRELWKVALPYSPDPTPRLESLFACPHFDPEGVSVVLSGQRAVGFASAIVPKDASGQPTRQRGYVTALAVHPEYEGESLGEHLLQRSEQFLLAHGLNQISATAFPEHYFLPGIDVRYTYLTDLFSEAGYRVSSQPVDMEVQWDRYVPPPWLAGAEAALSGQDYTVDYAKPEYQAAFLDFMQAHFSGTWYTRARVHMESGRELERAILVLNRSGDVVGFVRFGTYGDRGSIDSIGVRSDQRGKKLGSVLLARALQGMADRGATRGVFGYTGAIRFYETVGAQIVRRYQQFEKNLPS